MWSVRYFDLTFGVVNAKKDGSLLVILLTTVRFELTPLSRTQYYPFKGPSKLLGKKGCFTIGDTVDNCGIRTHV